MSGFWLSFIPKKSSYTLSGQRAKTIKNLLCYKDNVTNILTETREFIASGVNFENATCQSCKACLLDWWQGAMVAAYLKKTGFISRDITMPCCHKVTTLNNLIIIFTGPYILQ